ncbi:MAG: hypothetical protein V7K48_17530 [Nostoc sp.]|uniref:hypothetical protein n=1 Tax=Nostoc sp. TaxID=1180 RepID=UPI002FFC3154
MDLFQNCDRYYKLVVVFGCVSSESTASSTILLIRQRVFDTRQRVFDTRQRVF